MGVLGVVTDANSGGVWRLLAGRKGEKLSNVLRELRSQFIKAKPGTLRMDHSMTVRAK